MIKRKVYLRNLPLAHSFSFELNSSIYSVFKQFKNECKTACRCNNTGHIHYKKSDTMVYPIDIDIIIAELKPREISIEV